MFDTFSLPFVQDALWVLLPLSVAGGVLGTWIVLRGLAFYSHAVGTAAFPGLVLADGLGFAAPLGALGAAGVLAGGVWLVTRGRRTAPDSATAIVLVGCLALGVILASDVFESGSNIETLLFGSLLVVDGGDIRLAIAVALLTLLLTLALGPRWLARGFDPDNARSVGAGGRMQDAALLAAVALAAVAALSVVGALLATALLVVPAATTRLWFHRLVPWQVATVLLTALEGVAGVWLSVETDAPPGATIAVLAGGVFVLSAIAHVAPKPAALAAGAVLLTALAAGCGGGDASAAGKVPVVATTTQVADFTRAVGGDHVSVTQLLKPNTDPHDFEPRPSDVKAVADAKVVFASGLGLDDWIHDVARQSGTDAEVVPMDQTLLIRLPGEGGQENDPHWFQNPYTANGAVERIRDDLSRIDPHHAKAYEANAAAYLKKLKRLQSGIRACMDALPGEQRKLVTDHDAFQYFAAQFRIRVVGAVIPSQTTQAQPSAGDTAELARTIEGEHVKAIFPEESLNPDVAEALADQTGITAQYHLYGDTLGPAGSRGATYLGMQQANADAMVRGFTGGGRGCPIEGIG
jgi:ABC-type Zn uptake system ZnuABC Zn-binding protein ZnuA/ABC-type Mn2+/Zn2+ transport system permease subunit